MADVENEHESSTNHTTTASHLNTGQVLIISGETSYVSFYVSSSNMTLNLSW